MSKYIVEQEVDEVKFKKVHLNIEEFGNTLVELSAEELDQQLIEYSKQDFYVSLYYQKETENGIEFVMARYPINADKHYNFKPIIYKQDEITREYEINVTLFEVDIIEINPENMPYKRTVSLTDKELAERIRKYLEIGYVVNLGEYELKRRKWKLKITEIVKEVTEDGTILYR